MAGDSEGNRAADPRQQSGRHQRSVGQTVVVLPGECDEEITISSIGPTTIYTCGSAWSITLNRSGALPPNYA
ncbi:MAG: hypothetical protein ACLUGP_07610 [Faecalibacterium prausnitzii]